VIVVLLLAANMAANTVAHIFLKRSAAGVGAKRFLFWQAAGNIVSFLGVITYTVLLKRMPLHAAYPLTEGLTAIGVLVAGSLLFYKEAIRPIAWAGAGLVLAGVVLFSLP
jgi:multidrug transporter EmrE-like cation transporter